MNQGISQVIDSQRVADLEQQEQIAGAGVSANYIISEDFILPELEGLIDSAAISGSPLASTAVNQALSGGSPKPAIDEENYVPNSDEYEGSVNGSSGTGTDTAINNDAISTATGIEQDIEDRALNFDESEYSLDPDGDGYYEPDVEALEKWVQYMMTRANMLAGLLIALTSMFECRRLAEEAFTGESIEPEKHSYKEAFSRKIKTINKIVQSAVSGVFEYCNTKNKERLDERMEEITADADSSGHKSESTCNGGGSDISMSQEALQEQAKFYQATIDTLNGMQRVISMMIEFLAANAASDDFSTAGTISSLTKFSARLEEMGEEVDEKLQAVLREVDEMANYEAWGWVMFALSFLGIGLIGGIIWAIVANARDGMGDNLEEINLDLTSEFVNGYRGDINVMQNAYRMFLSLSLFKTDLRNTVREQFTGLSGMKNDAELLMQSAEGTLGHTTQVFDSATSQLMLKVSLHNNMVRGIKELDQLIKAQPLRSLSMATTIVMAIVGLVITIITWGSFAPLYVAIISALVGVLQGITNYFATKIANDLDTYDPIEPEYFYNDHPGIGATAIDAINGADGAGRQNLEDATLDQGMIRQADDEYYYFDSPQFALYELRQKLMDNIIRALFSVMKNARDMRRVAMSEFSGNAPADSGGSLLQNAIESILLQRQLILSAIKFQYQEVITARNIEKRVELAQEDAWKSFGWSIIGGLVGGGLGAIGGPGLSMLGYTLGSTLGSTLYRLIHIISKHYWDMEIDEASLARLQEFLQQQGEESTEARLDAAEVAAYQDLLTNGLVGTGGGWSTAGWYSGPSQYHGVNFGLVSETYARLGRIYAAQEAVAKGRSMGSILRDIVKQQMSGKSIGKVGALSESVNRASFSASMRVAGELVSFLNTRADIMNRAYNAKKELIMSIVSASVNTILSVVGMSLGGLKSPILSALGKLAPAVMSLVNSLTSFITGLVDANGDLGAYENYNTKTEVDKTGRRVKTVNGVDERLDQLEYEIMCQVNSGMIETLSGGYMAVSAEYSQLSSGMKSLFNVREALATARSILTSARESVRYQMSGKQLDEVTFGKDSIDNFKQASLSILDSLKSALDTMAERYNQMQDAEAKAWTGGIQSLFSLSSLVVSVVNSCASGHAEELSRPSGQGGTDAAVVGNQQQAEALAPAEVAAPEAPAATDVPAAAEKNDSYANRSSKETDARTSGAKPYPTVAAQPVADSLAPAAANAQGDETENASENTGRAEREEELDFGRGRLGQRTQTQLRQLQETLRIVGGTISLTGRIVNIIMQSVFATRDDDSEEARSRTAAVNRKVEKGESEAKSGPKNIFTSLDDLETKTNLSEYKMAVLQLNKSMTARIAQNYTQLVEMVRDEVKNVIDYAKNFDRGPRNAAIGTQHRADAEAPDLAPVPGSISVTNYAQTHTPEATARYILENFEAAEIEPICDQLVQMEGPRGRAVLEALQQQARSQGAETVAVRAEAALAAAPAPVVQQNAEVTHTPVEQNRPSSRVHLERADRIEEQMQQVAQEAETLEARATQINDQVAGLEQEMSQVEAQLDEVTPQVQAAQAEDVPALTERVEALRLRRDQLQAEWSGLVEQRGQVEAELTACRANVQRLDEEMTQLIADLEQQAQAEQDPVARQQLLDRAELVRRVQANDPLTERVIQLEGRLAEINGRLGAVRQELQTVQRQITRLDQLIQEKQASQQPASNGDSAAVRSGGFGNVFSFVRDFLRPADQRRQENLDNVSEGEVLPGQRRGANHDDAIVAVANAGQGRYSPQRRYEDAMRDLDVVARQLSADSERVSSVNQSGVC